MDAIQQKLVNELTVATNGCGNKRSRIEGIVANYGVTVKPDEEEGKAIFAEWLFKMMELREQINRMPDRKLAWYFLMCPGIHQLPSGSLPGELIDEVLTRLYPEWDGEVITSTAWGWRTPLNDVVYLKEEYEKEECKNEEFIYE